MEKTNKKAALRLTVNLIVTLIIGIACILFATTFFLQEHGEMEALTEVVEQQVQQQIMKEMTQTNQKVVLPIFSADLRRGETYIFGLGIKNYLGYKEEFTVKVSFDSAENTETKAIVQPNANMNKFFISEQGPYELDDAKQKILGVPFRVVEGTAKGITYKFNVAVECKADNTLCKPYGYPQQIEINVI